MSLIPWKGKQHEQERSEPADAHALSRFRSEMDRLFDRFFSDPWGLVGERQLRGADWMPSVDVSENEEEVVVRAEVAGVDPKAIDITVSGQLLTICGEKTDSSESRGEDYYRSERQYGSFRRSLQLPSSVDVDQASAEHKNGVLTIRLKKHEGTKPKRITVRTS